MGTLTVVGFGLAILFVTVSGILANSLRHREKAVASLKRQLGAGEAVISDLNKELYQNKNTMVSNNELNLAVSKAKSLEIKNTALRSRLENSYERVGKRFQKVGKV